MTHEEIVALAREAAGGMFTYDGEGSWQLSSQEAERFFWAAYAAGAADERKACAQLAGEFAQKWWSIHCASNKHMETTRRAHEDFCALQAAIRALGRDERSSTG